MSLKKLPIFLLLAMMLFTASCTPVTSAASVEAPLSAEVSQPEPVTLTVLAAASLTESFTELGELFESQNPGVTVAFSFAGSQALAEQLEQGAEVDVFASANNKYMDAVIKAERVNEGACCPGLC